MNRSLFKTKYKLNEQYKHTNIHLKNKIILIFIIKNNNQTHKNKNKIKIKTKIYKLNNIKTQINTQKQNK